MPIRSWQDLINDAGGAGDSYEPIPAGDYDFVVSQADATQSSTGKTMYKVRCKVEQGPHKDRLVFHQFTISPENPNALAMFFRQMNVLGLNREFFSSNPGDHQVAEAINGKRFRGQVQIKTWQGQERNEIKQMFTAVQGALGSGGPTPGSGPQIPATAPAPAPQPAPAPAPAPAAPAPAPAPEYAAPAAPTPAPAPEVAAPPVPEPVVQAETPAVETPAAPPAAPAPAPAPAAASPTAPAPPPF